ncbi:MULTISPECIES: ABC transporter permease [unclassified Saccharopolyspora]|uniref:ABC transporter permease n=1 Tax=unclassified Saccharopolyspora TaxID=2646250 RepID=UPI001CD33391|nr:MULTISPECIES: ABC transporter permease [unclassified Saccharopolyspora]MCA1185145.1 ABC transporter permease [Saccharopolyspora sp. 6T]MCA1191379.1 ABC transporter permease [Saccharopolyspora sp. 6V]MCA1225020.1 ABC transporter permease [Saccharopolyspora sp. 6M]MCA1278489.1 ABC transporter permease [Saccharopolyspora sp. 7B]
MTTIPDTPTRRWRGAAMPAQVYLLSSRSLRALLVDPRMLLFSMLQPLIMLVLFSQVFGKAITVIDPPGGNYINYLMPAILITTSIGAGLQSGIGLISDMHNGVVARLRALPIHLSSVLLARSVADLVRSALQLIVLLTTAAALFGFSPQGGFWGVVASLVLALVVSWSLTWVFLAIATWVRKAEVMQSIGFLAMFPLMFVSSAFVPLEALPNWLRVLAVVNPLTYAVDASRNLALALPTGNGVFLALGTSAVLGAISAVFAVRGFRKPL